MELLQVLFKDKDTKHSLCAIIKDRDSFTIKNLITM